MIRLTHSALQLTNANKLASKLARSSSLLLDLKKQTTFVTVKPISLIQSNKHHYSSSAQKNKVDLTSEEDQKRLIFTIPNALTSLRILSVPFINYYIFAGQHEVACGLFVASALTDALDGYIARNVPNQLSHLGSILDPLADKLLIGMWINKIEFYREFHMK